MGSQKSQTKLSDSTTTNQKKKKQQQKKNRPTQTEECSKHAWPALLRTVKVKTRKLSQTRDGGVVTGNEGIRMEGIQELRATFAAVL